MEELSQKIIAYLASVLYKKIAKERLTQKDFEKKVEKIANYISELIRQRIFYELIDKEPFVNILGQVISKSIETDIGEMDFQIKTEYYIETSEKDFFYNVNILIEHKFGKTSKSVYQLFRDIIYECSNFYDDLILGISIHNGSILRLVFSAYKNRKGYVLSSHKIYRFPRFRDKNDFTVLLKREEILNLIEGFRKSNNKKAFAKKILFNYLLK